MTHAAPDNNVIGMKNRDWIGIFCGALVLSSCSDFGGSSGSAGYDPLSQAGFRKEQGASVMGLNYQFNAGQFVTAASNSTAFFSKKPSGNADADELLAAGTTMRVIKSEGSFVKVELDSGKVGYVAAALLLESQQNMAPTLPEVPSHGDALPLPGDLPAAVDPATNELPPSSLDSPPSTQVPLPEPSKGNTVPKSPSGQ